MTVAAPARIGGALTAHVRDADNVDVAPGATVAGGTDVRVAESPETRSEYLTVSFYLQIVLRIAAAFLTGWLLFWLAPRFADVRLDTTVATLKTVGIGFLCVIAVPVGALIVAVTVVGLPLAVIAVWLWLAGLYLGKILIAAFLGGTLLGRDRQMAAVLLTGLVAVYVAANLPLIGWVINLAVTIAGMGVLFTQLVAWCRELAAPQTVAR